MPNTTPGFFAGADVNPSRFVTIQTNEDHVVETSGANALIFGISHEGTEDVPIPSAATFAASDGKPIKIYGEGAGDVLLEAGASFNAGTRLKADSVGRGIAIATTGTDNQNYGAIALENAAVNEKIRVFVTIGTHRPSPSS